MAPLPAAATAAASASPPSATQATTPSDPGLDQTIDPNQAQGTGRVVRPEGHLDFGPTYVEGEWRLQMHDDSEVPSVWRNLSDIVVHVVDAAIRPVPDDPDFAFLPAGKSVYVIPQTQTPGIAWLGWNTQQPAAVALMGQGVEVSITHVTGPGEVTVFLQSGNFSAPNVLWSSDALPGTIWMERNSHTHANWVFTEPGAYLLDMTFTADLADGNHVSVADSLRFAVGDATDPEAVFKLASSADGPGGNATGASPGEGGTEGGSAGTGGSGTGGSGSDTNSTASLGLGAIGPWGWAGLGAVVVALGAGGLALFRRRHAGEPASEHEERP